ncbi:hypothetical protein ASPZODRAFT_140568 [Penicilliopsis zonata CBS 506.65]|uniref:Uncharacterized protein n=1 Tax=Penicilliopsis zonata CBS 506.65 TaxID=1073090 RepID=A0A1L9SMH4_9EURO|nr:hypothetical protein ASPZODRAFT_140568 [Penicilliopsis zonata CBS 506.65]OJJ48254.1 hypothetical protein ASPZODRAFT_140568 [Penicilliopsis zonata CBS 506.65]
MSASYYEPQGWQAPSARQVSWEQPAPPSRSGSSSVSQREESPAFSSQFDEVDRAIDNLVKSGKLWTAPRRDSMPMMMGRPYPEYELTLFQDPRSASSMPPRHHSISEFDGARMHPSPNLQGFYAAQRFQGRPGEMEQMMQAKRRMAAQRERELRNYHQEQQYNRSLLAEMSGTKSDRSVSPAAMSEESRRELLTRQHRALYGNESPAFFPAGSFDDSSRPDSQAGATPSSGVRGSSPRGVDPFAPDNQVAAALQSPSRANSTSSPSSGVNVNQVYGKLDSSVDGPVTSTSSPTGADSPSARGGSVGSGPSGAGPTAKSNMVGPIGSSRPGPPGSGPGGVAINPSLNKRSTTPLPSPLGFGFSKDAMAGGPNERSTSSASNNPPSSAAAGPSGGAKESSSSSSVGLGWGNSSGVWGKNGLGVQASVWG